MAKNGQIWSKNDYLSVVIFWEFAELARGLRLHLIDPSKFLRKYPRYHVRQWAIALQFLWMSAWYSPISIIKNDSILSLLLSLSDWNFKHFLNYDSLKCLEFLSLHVFVHICTCLAKEMNDLSTWLFFMPAFITQFMDFLRSP